MSASVAHVSHLSGLVLLLSLLISVHPACTQDPGYRATIASTPEDATHFLFGRYTGDAGMNGGVSLAVVPFTFPTLPPTGTQDDAHFTLPWDAGTSVDADLHARLVLPDLEASVLAQGTSRRDRSHTLHVGATGDVTYSNRLAESGAPVMNSMDVLGVWPLAGSGADPRWAVVQRSGYRNEKFSGHPLGDAPEYEAREARPFSEVLLVPLFERSWAAGLGSPDGEDRIITLISVRIAGTRGSSNPVEDALSYGTEMDTYCYWGVSVDPRVFACYILGYQYTFRLPDTFSLAHDDLLAYRDASPRVPVVLRVYPEQDPDWAEKHLARRSGHNDIYPDQFDQLSWLLNFAGAAPNPLTASAGNSTVPVCTEYKNTNVIPWRQATGPAGNTTANGVSCMHFAGPGADPAAPAFQRSVALVRSNAGPYELAAEEYTHYLTVVGSPNTDNVRVLHVRLSFRTDGGSGVSCKSAPGPNQACTIVIEHRWVAIDESTTTDANSRTWFEQGFDFPSQPVETVPSAANDGAFQRVHLTYAGARQPSRFEFRKNPQVHYTGTDSGEVSILIQVSMYQLPEGGVTSESVLFYHVPILLFPDRNVIVTSGCYPLRAPELFDFFYLLRAADLGGAGGVVRALRSPTVLHQENLVGSTPTGSGPASAQTQATPGPRTAPGDRALAIPLLFPVTSALLVFCFGTV